MKIVLIKLGALGDVVRTLPIAEAIKKKYKGSELTWITKPNAIQLFENNPYVDNIFPLPYNTEKDKFDILINLDIEEEATNLAESIKADKKLGFFSESGYASAFNIGAEYYLNTLFDDELKKTNKKTYQEMMFQAAELNYMKERPIMNLSEKDKQYALDYLSNNNIKTENLIGIHMGAAPTWPSKVWHKDNLKEFIEMSKNKGYNLILFGGPHEADKIDSLINELNQKNIEVYKNNPNNTIMEFSSLVNHCQQMICSDSLSLHIALALNKKTIGLFFCTSPDEVEGYDLMKKISSSMLYDFFPEKMDQYDETLVKSISADDVLNALQNN